MAGQGVFHHYDVPSVLAPYVRRLWSYRCEQADGFERIVPDGCPELVIDLADPTQELTADGQQAIQPAILMAGQLTRPMTLKTHGRIHVVGVGFQPDGARDFWGAPLHTLTDRRLDASSRLPARIVALEDEAELVAGLTDWLVHQASGWSLDQEVRAALSRDTVPDHTAAERRNLQRRFLDRVGVSSRMLRSVLRFRSVFDRAEDNAGWLEAGLNAGYFDQPQLARDFQRFLSCSATQWAREELALSRAILSSSYKPDGTSSS